jgi:choline dehydrogenase-like flavoprotein
MYDVCIVGSGAGAGPVAYELCQAGYKVVILEKGPWIKREQMFKDEIAICRRSTFTPRLDKEQHVIEEQIEGKWQATPTTKSGRDFWNGSMVGGSSNLMSGYFHRMKPKDFKLLSSYGAIEGANIVDWCISYEEMEPFYAKVEQVVGVSGKVVNHPFLEPRSTINFPYYPTIEHGICKWFDRACAKEGLVSIPTPRAVLPFRVGERGGCEYAGYCGSYGCATGAKGSSREALLNKALKTGNLTILADTFVKKLVSAKEDVKEAICIGKDGNEFQVSAKLFVVAAQAIESVRLLLNSKSQSFPNGLANNSGQVGRNIIFSAGGAGAGTFYDDDLASNDVKELHKVGPFVNRSIQDWYEIQDKDRVIKGATVDFLFEHNNPVSRAKSLLNEELVWGDTLKKKLVQRFTKERTLNFEIFCDWLPTDDTRVSIDSEVKDQWGVPVARLKLGAHAHDLKVGEKVAVECEKLLKTMGAKDIYSSISASPPPNLVAGGCRFGDNPATSVLDRNCKAHELNNLYVTDASFMPTGGSVPYTWTIYANAFRVTNSIIEHLQKL